MKRRNSLLVGILILLAVLVTACGGQAASDETVMDRGFAEVAAIEESDFSQAVPAMAPEAEMAYDMAEGAAMITNDTTALQAADESRLIIRTGDISVVVADTDEVLARIAAMAEDNGGWVVSSYVFQADENAKHGTITIRVPAEGFQSALDAISGMAVEVQSLSTSGQDVTEEYVDLEARLGNLEATADRVRGFMDETRNVEDALAVNQN
ncbi:MAG: DUF4349 domain-containing protein [Chloroflexota bacterium]